MTGAIHKFEKYIPKFEYELVNLNEYDEQEIANFGNALSLILIIDKIRPDGGMGVFRRLPVDYIEKLKQNIPPHLYKLLADVITVLLRRINVPDIEIEKVTEQLHERRIQEMFPFFENYDVQETRRIAKAELSSTIAKNCLPKATQWREFAGLLNCHAKKLNRFATLSNTGHLL